MKDYYKYQGHIADKTIELHDGIKEIATYSYCIPYCFLW